MLGIGASCNDGRLGYHVAATGGSRSPTSSADREIHSAWAGGGVEPPRATTWCRRCCRWWTRRSRGRASALGRRRVVKPPQGPGLIGALLVGGCRTTKSLAWGGGQAAGRSRRLEGQAAGNPPARGRWPSRRFLELVVLGGPLLGAWKWLTSSRADRRDPRRRGGQDGRPRSPRCSACRTRAACKSTSSRWAATRRPSTSTRPHQERRARLLVLGLEASVLAHLHKHPEPKGERRSVAPRSRRRSPIRYGWRRQCKAASISGSERLVCRRRCQPNQPAARAGGRARPGRSPEPPPAAWALRPNEKPARSSPSRQRPRLPARRARQPEPERDPAWRLRKATA